MFEIERTELEWILDASEPGETFRVFRDEEIKQFGEYRTKRVILEIYDAMHHAIDTGTTYQTRLDPPPADPSVGHSLIPAQIETEEHSAIRNQCEK